MLSRVHSCICSTTMIHLGARLCAAPWEPGQKPDRALACTVFRIDRRRQTNAQQSIMPPGDQGAAASRRPAWGPRCPSLPAECLKVTQNPSFIPQSTSPFHPSPASAGLASWAARPSEDGGQSVKVRLNVSLYTRRPVASGKSLISPSHSVLLC